MDEGCSVGMRNKGKKPHFRGARFMVGRAAACVQKRHIQQQPWTFSGCFPELTLSRRLLHHSRAGRDLEVICILCGTQVSSPGSHCKRKPSWNRH